MPRRRRTEVSTPARVALPSPPPAPPLLLSVPLTGFVFCPSLTSVSLSLFNGLLEFSPSISRRTPGKPGKTPGKKVKKGKKEQENIQMRCSFTRGFFSLSSRLHKREKIKTWTRTQHSHWLAGDGWSPIATRGFHSGGCFLLSGGSLNSSEAERNSNSCSRSLLTLKGGRLAGPQLLLLLFFFSFSHISSGCFCSRLRTRLVSTHASRHVSPHLDSMCPSVSHSSSVLLTSSLPISADLPLPPTVGS